VQYGDFVAIDMSNRPEFLLGWFAIQSLGAVMVATNIRSSEDELRYYLRRAGVSVVLTERSRLAHGHRSASEGVKVIALDDAIDRWDAPGQIEYPDIDPMAYAGVQFTSGTTSRPKGVVWTHANYLWGAKASAAHERLLPTDRHLTYLPLFHTNAQIYSVMATLWVGGTIVLLPRFSTSRFWESAVAAEATWSSMINFSLRALLDRPVPRDHRFRAWGAPALNTDWEQRFGIPMIAWWGMTETVTHGIVSDLDGRRRDRAIGRPADGYQLRLHRRVVCDEERSLLSRDKPVG